MTIAECYKRGRCTADEARSVLRREEAELLKQFYAIQDGLRRVYLELAEVAQAEAVAREQVAV